MRWLLAPVLLVSGYAAGQAGTGGAELEGRVLAASCGGCHRSGPAREDGIPSLEGLTAEEIEEKLLAYRSGELAGTLMNRLAAGYTDEEIAILAATLGRD